MIYQTMALRSLKSTPDYAIRRALNRSEGRFSLFSGPRASLPERGAPGPYRSLLKGDDRTVEVSVRDNDVDQALRALKKKMQREGIFREMKMRRSYEKPSERRAREKAEAIRRARKLERKRMEREGF